MEKDNEGVFIPKHETYKTKGKNFGKTKGSTYIDDNIFNEIFDYIELKLKKIGNGILSGDSASAPVGSKSCKYCDYYPICCFESGEPIKIPSLKNGEVMEKIREEIENGI